MAELEAALQHTLHIVLVFFTCHLYHPCRRSGGWLSWRLPKRRKTRRKRQVHLLGALASSTNQDDSSNKPVHAGSDCV